MSVSVSVSVFNHSHEQRANRPRKMRAARLECAPENEPIRGRGFRHLHYDNLKNVSDSVSDCSYLRKREHGTSTPHLPLVIAVSTQKPPDEASGTHGMQGVGGSIVLYVAQPGDWNGDGRTSHRHSDQEWLITRRGLPPLVQSRSERIRRPRLNARSQDPRSLDATSRAEGQGTTERLRPLRRGSTFQLHG